MSSSDVELGQGPPGPRLLSRSSAPSPAATPSSSGAATSSDSVQGGDTDVFSRSYIVSVGGRDGVKAGYPVVWGNIALGRISKVGALYSRVRVLADPKSRVTVRFGAGRYEGVLVGNGRQLLPGAFRAQPRSRRRYQGRRRRRYRGTDGFFPPDLVVGKRVALRRRPSEPEADVEVELELDFSRIENCLVLKRDDSGVRDLVAPPEARPGG